MDNHEEFLASCVLYAFYSEVEHMDRDSDSFMHYGRIGMKWHQHIFGDDTRIGRMKKAASKAADSLRGLEVYGDKMREGVAKFRTQTQAEANRWRMDNGYTEDSYKKYHAEKRARESAAREKEAEANSERFRENFKTYGYKLRQMGNPVLHHLTDHPIRFTTESERYELNDMIRRKTNRMKNYILERGDFRSKDAARQTVQYMNDKVQTARKRLSTFFEQNSVKSLNPTQKNVLWQMETSLLGLMAATDNLNVMSRARGDFGNRDEINNKYDGNFQMRHEAGHLEDLYRFR